MAISPCPFKIPLFTVAFDMQVFNHHLHQQHFYKSFRVFALPLSCFLATTVMQTPFLEHVYWYESQ